MLKPEQLECSALNLNILQLQRPFLFKTKTYLQE